MLGNKMLTDVRPTVQHEQGQRGMKVGRLGVHRWLLLRAGDKWARKARARLKAVFETADPNNEISAGCAWALPAPGADEPALNDGSQRAGEGMSGQVSGCVEWTPGRRQSRRPTRHRRALSPQVWTSRRDSGIED